MPTEDEIKIILNVVNADKIDQAKAAIEREEEAIRKLSAALAAGAINQAQFDAAGARSAQNIQTQVAAIKAAGGAFNGRALMEGSRLVEDLQYGLNGAINNVPGLVQALGGSNGLVGVISLAAVGTYQLVKHWDDLATLFGGGKTLSEAAAMEKLAEKTKLTADETERLARYKSVQGKTTELQGGQTEAQRAQESAVTKALIEAGPENVAKGLLKTNPEAFDRAIPGIEGTDKKLLQNFKGENRTAVTDARDAQQTLEDYVSGKSREVSRSDRAGGSHVEALDPAKLQELQIAAGDASKALDEARQAAALQQTSTAALAKLFPGGLGQLRDLVTANPDAFGPKGNQLRKDLTTAAKTPEDIEDEKAAAHAEAQEQEYRNRLAEFQEKGRQEEDAQDKAAREHAEAQERQYREKLANWQYQAHEQRQNEDAAAINQDAMAAWHKQREKGMQTSQIFGSAAFHDQIQQSAKGLDRDPTAVEQLAVSRQTAENTKRMMERLENMRQGPARAG